MRTYKMNRHTMAILDAALRKINNEYFDGRIDIYDRVDFEDYHVTFEINWAAIGSVNPEEAKKFATNILVATAIAEKLNSYDMVMAYEDSKYLNHLESEGHEKVKAACKSLCDNLVFGLMCHDSLDMWMDSIQSLEEKYA